MNRGSRFRKEERLSLKDVLINIVLAAIAITIAISALVLWAESLPPAPNEDVHIRLMKERGIG